VIENEELQKPMICPVELPDGHQNIQELPVKFLVDSIFYIH